MASGISAKPQVRDDEVVVSAAHSERMLSILESGVGDLTILAGKQKTPIPVQKMFLTAASPVFREMYSTSTTRDKDVDSGKEFIQTLELTEMTEEEVRLFLKFIYAGTKPDKVESALPLLRAAKTYDIPDLGKHCAELLETKLSEESALHIYEQARLYNNEHLMKSTMEYICKNATKIVELDQFLELSVEALGKILEEDSLAVADEVQLFNATIRWAHAEINRQRASITPSNTRSVLEKVIQLIRFPQMDPTVFTCIVLASKVLTTDQIVEALLYYNVPENLRCFLAHGLFNARPRQYAKPNLTGLEYKISRKHTVLISDQAIPQPVFVANHSCAIRFIADTQIWLRRIHVDFTFTSPTQSYDPRYGGYKYNHVYDVFPFNSTDKLQIVIEDNPQKQVLVEKTVHFAKTEPTSGSDRCILTVPLPTDLRIPKDTECCATFRISSTMLRDRRLGGSEDQAVISALCPGWNGQNEKVVFVFEETESKPFFAGVSFDFLVN